MLLFTVVFICIYLTKKNNIMKKTGIIFLAAVVLTAVSCSSDNSEDEVKVEAVTYELDEANSSIAWKGGMSADYFHSGTVKFSEGSITMEDGKLTSGSFTVDMNTIDDTSLEDPKSEALAAHLKGTMPDDHHPVNMFFNTPKYPNATVKLGEYKDGKLAITLNVIGVTIEQNVPIQLTANEKGASIKGAFSLDLAALKVPGFATQEDGSAISSVIEFDVNAILIK